MNENIVEFKDITMAFGKVIANDNISIEIKKGKIHALIGENGAGKSTLMSILFGMYTPTNGVIKINGNETSIKSPSHATKLGLGMVHQHFKLVGIYNAVENIMLGREETKNGFLNRKLAREKIEALVKKYHFEIDTKKSVQKMSIGQQQKVEILKMLYSDAEILIFDEPTAVLSPKEIDGFLKLLKKFRADGKTIILITHKLEEIKQVADTATVIRLGKVVETNINVQKTTIKKMSELMVGKAIVKAKTNRKVLSNTNVLKLENITLKARGRSNILNDISFEVKRGEIVAIAGVEGNGQTELSEVISGLRKHSKGNIILNGVNLNKLSIDKRNLLGVSHIPEDRHKYGLVLDLPLWESMTLNTFTRKPYSNFGMINNKQRKLISKAIIFRFDVRGSQGGTNSARSLSGGNQQKAIVGREMTNNHDLLVAVQPTRGLDLGAISFIHNEILKEKNNNKGILLISYDLSDVLALADKVIVFNNGTIIKELTGTNISRKEIGQAMASTKKAVNND